MSDTWSFPDNTSQDVEKFLMLAQMEAHHTPEGLEAFALLVNGLGASRKWRDQVRAAAGGWATKATNVNSITSDAVALIGRALALVRESNSD